MTITLPLQQQDHPGYLGDGTHHVRITSARESVAKTGTEQLVIELEAVDGPNAGKIARAWLSLTQSATPFLAYFANAVFPDSDADLIQNWCDHGQTLCFCFHAKAEAG